MQNRADLIKNILEHGYRIFTIEQFAKLANHLGYSNKSIGSLAFEMKKSKLIDSIKPGLFQLSDSYLSSPISAYEVGLKVVPGGYLSHLSAVAVHGLTDQLANIIYISVEIGKSRYCNKEADFNFEAKGAKYKIIEILKERIFGLENKWYGDSQISITDLERTLIDCMNAPQYAAGFYEVLSYFHEAKEKINLEKIIQYALKLSISSMQRLGWCFEKIEFYEGAKRVMEKINAHSWVKLDTSGKRKGVYNKKWKIIENL